MKQFMIFNKHHGIIVLLLLQTFIASGTHQIQFEKISVEDGLSSNTISSIAQDNDGRIWLATYDGITCFDGSGYHVIRHIPSSGKNTIPSGQSQQIRIDNIGNIWILFEGNQLVRLLDLSGKCIYYPRFESIPENDLVELDVDDQGNLLLTNASACYRYDPGKDDFSLDITYDFNSSHVSVLAQIRQKLQKVIPGVLVHSYFSDKDRNITWIATLNQGIYKINGDDYAHAINYNTGSPGKSAISGNEVYCVFVDKNGTVWAGTKDGGVSKSVSLENSAFQTLEVEKQGIAHGAIRAIAKDKYQRLWLGYYNNGISVLDNKHTIPLKFRAGKEDKWNWVRCILHDPDGYMWVGSYNGLCRINCDNLNDVQYFSAGSNPNSITNNRIYSIVQDQQKNLYIGEWGGIDYFNKKENRFTRIDIFSGLKGKRIRKLMLSSKGNLWVATESDGVYVVDTVRYDVVAHYVASQGLRNNSVFELFEDMNGTVWIGTFGGLNSVNRDGHVSSYPEVDKQLPSTLIYRIFSDSAGNLWCATIKGVVKVNPGENYVRIYDQPDGITVPEFSEGAGFQDRDGYIFFGGVEGLISFNPDSVKISRHIPDVFLNSLLVNEQKVELHYPLSGSNPLSLSFWHNDLTFSIHSVLINSPHKNKLAWKLIPSDKDFQYFNGSTHDVQYQNLRPGNYTLVVKAANADGVWMGEKKLITVTIPRPFWHELYFILGFSTFLLVLFAFLVRIRFNQIKRKNARLEELVNQRTRKIEKQKIELENKNEALEQRNQKVQAQKDQILAQRDHLLEMYDKLEELTRLRDNFFANISHDIRTPLTLIYGPTSELLKEKDLPEEITSKIKIIEYNTKYMIQLLDQILNRKKLETDRVVKVFTQGNIVDTCRFVVSSFLDQAKQNRIELDFDSNLSVYFIRFDHEKLKQILFNIMANAMKFTPPEGIIKCRLTIENGQIQIEVKDTGIGIPKDRIKHIFDRYYQIGKSSLNDKNRGVGIGLAMVKEYVQLLNGEVTVYSEEGKGSSFVVVLPVVQSELADNEATNSVTESEESKRILSVQAFPGTGVTPDLVGETVLLAEDNDGLRQYLQEFLSRYFKVIPVKNGKEALKYLKKNNAVDIVLSDWIMPEMDGIELCRAIRRKSRFQTLPFILLTTLTDISHEKEGYFAGITDFIPKPFDPEIVYLKITKLLRLNSQIQQKLKVSEVTYPEEIVVETYNDKLLKKIMAIIGEEISNVNLDPSTLANHAGMSPTQLYRKIKELVKMTPVEFIRSVRIKRAVQLLENENILVNEVSDLVGFNDPRYFSRCFSKETGMSPSQYRNFSLKKLKSSG